MERFDANEILFFFGAGASAAFGIPTMKQFVADFEAYLNKDATSDERELYSDIKRTLEAKSHKKPDLEAIFSVIDGIISYDDPAKLGMFALYFSKEFRAHFPTFEHVKTAEKLKKDFQRYVKENCAIQGQYYQKIRLIYKDFFNRFAIESEYAKSPLNYSWTIFTTNYDLTLEYYWCEVLGKGIDTNFEWNPNKKMNILNQSNILLDCSGKPKLFKLHGSISWQIEGKNGEIVEVLEDGTSLFGRSYVGELMLYPIAEKQLYLEPFIRMFLRLNQELKKKNTWVVIGYSFNDQVIREIFLKNSSAEKRLILVHPHAEEIVAHKFKGSKAKLIPINQKFGIVENKVTADYKPYNHLNHQILYNVLGGKPSLDADFKPKQRDSPMVFFG